MITRDYLKQVREHDQLRRELAGLVRGEDGYEDARELAKRVNAAPAFQTLRADEWWNVALRLALEIARLTEEQG